MNDKILADIKVAYPIFGIITEYSYRKVRTPTVFEELLMDLAENFPQLKNHNLAQICHRLALDEVFIRYTLQHLAEIELIEERDFDEKHLENISLSELVLTPLGQQFYKEKQMPGKRRIEKKYFYFNPLVRQYDKEPKDDEKNVIKLKEDLFNIDENILQQLSFGEHTKLLWYSPDVRLEENGIQHRVFESFGQAVKIKLTLDHNRYVDLHCTEQDFSQWLKTRTPQVKREHLLSPMLKKANHALSDSSKLEVNETDLLSLVLADQRSDLSKLPKTIVMMKTVEDNQIEENSPLIILSNLQEEATLVGNVLFIPNKDHLSKQPVQMYVDFASSQVFAEYHGYLPSYFDYQPLDLPVKMIVKDQNNLENFGAFRTPNLDTLVFMANYLPENDIVEKLPMLSIEQAVEFNEKIANTWNGKVFSPISWAKKIELLQSEQDLAAFEKLFPKVPLTLKQFDKKMHADLLDKAIKEPNSNAAKLPEFSDLLNVMRLLSKLSSEKLALNIVNQGTLNNVESWKKIATEFNRTYPQACLSTEFTKKSSDLTAWRERVERLFEPLVQNKKFAVLDTNFIRHKPQELAKIQAERTVILPKVVLDELDSQKEMLKRELSKENDHLTQMDTQPLQNEIDTLAAKITSKNADIEALDVRLKEKQAALKVMEMNNVKEK